METKNKYKYHIVDDNTLRTIKTKSTNTKSIMLVTSKEILVYTIAIFLILGGLFGYKIHTIKQYYEVTLNGALDIECDNINKEQMFNIYYQIGKYKLEGKQVIPTDSLQVVYDLIKENAWYPNVIFAQLVLESGSGKSMLAQQANNLFGMKLVAQRPTTQLYNTNYTINECVYGKYLNWQHSILDRILWDYNFFSNKPSETEYMNVIKARYAEDPNYVNKLIQLIEQTKKKYETQ